jgi:NAD+ kinase
MRIALFGKSISDADQPYIQKLIQRLENINAQITVYESFFTSIAPLVKFEKEADIFKSHKEIEKNTDFLLSIGGDGTFLETLNLIRNSGIPVLGINIGRLGFLSSISKDEIDYSISSLVNGNYTLENRALLQIVEPESLFGEMSYALNEITISRKESTSLMMIEVYIDGRFLNSYWADGLIVATPTGSTAYSLSCGGPIVTPGSENFLITPIATHNLTVRPVVIRDDSTIRIKVQGRDKNFFVSLDSKFKSIEVNTEITLKKADYSINLVQMKNKNFFSTIRDKLNWGLDKRN